MPDTPEEYVYDASYDGASYGGAAYSGAAYGASESHDSPAPEMQPWVMGNDPMVDAIAARHMLQPDPLDPEGGFDLAYDYGANAGRNPYSGFPEPNITAHNLGVEDVRPVTFAPDGWEPSLEHLSTAVRRSEDIFPLVTDSDQQEQFMIAAGRLVDARAMSHLTDVGFGGLSGATDYHNPESPTEESEFRLDVAARASLGLSESAMHYTNQDTGMRMESTRTAAAIKREETRRLLARAAAAGNPGRTLTSEDVKRRRESTSSSERGKTTPPPKPKRGR